VCRCPSQQTTYLFLTFDRDNHVTVVKMAPKFGGAAKCPKCDKAVYFAEQLLYNNVAWHKTCFCCTACKKKLETGNARDHDTKPYCAPCHGKEFGPKGYGFGGGSGALSNTGQ